MYSIRTNLATISNKVTEYIEGSRLNSQDVDLFSAPVSAFEEGYPVWYLRGYQLDHINPENGFPEFVDQLTIDSDGDGVFDTADGSITVDDKTYIGDGIPDFTYGATISLHLKISIFLPTGQVLMVRT